MIRTFATIVFLTAALASQALNAQGGPASSPDTKEHEFLQRFVGEWNVKSSGSGVTGTSVMKSSMIGKLWVVNNSELNMSGFEMKAIQMIGYDPAKKKYVGIWADSMMNYMWRYEGAVDKSGNVLTLNAEGPSMTGDGKTSKYQDIYEFKDKDSFVAISKIQDEDGKWTVMMKGAGERIKKKAGTTK